MQKSEFLRLFPLRAPNLMWFLGAGASASAGIRTAGQMIWHFKQQIYCTEQRISSKSCPELSDQAFRARLDRYFQSQGGYPAPGSDDEYAFYFERALPAEVDRRSYIDRMVSGFSPSQGHLALAALAKLNLLRVIWTTNFDRLVEDALVKVLGSTSAFAAGTLDASDLVQHALSDARRPVLAKLHGDFLSRRLKNTSEELRAQDARLRRCLLEECHRQGLVVVGYSGRDHSVMEMLEAAIDNGNGYPGGLFWFHRPDGEPANRVTQLIKQARAVGIDAHLIEVETFDELMVDLFLLVENVPDDLRSLLSERRSRLTQVRIPEPGNQFPFIRLNALPVIALPNSCRLIECQIGNTREVRDAIKAASAQVIAARRDVGVIAFGSDSEIRRAFEPHRITRFDLYPIDAERLSFDTAEQGLLTEALVHALVRERPLLSRPCRRGHLLYIDPQRADDVRAATLKAAAGQLVGVVPNTTLRWAEAVRVRLERRLDRNWFLFEPSVWIDYPDAEEECDCIGEDEPVSAGKPLRNEAAREFIRERAAKRYNYVLAKLFNGWVDLIVGPGSNEHATLRAFGIGDGIDASFTLSRVTAFSGRGGR
jgi:NAD-dependent SIR2 family protein deacetylase